VLKKMKTILICPNQASGMPALADSKPLVTLPFLGERFICYWLQHLAVEKYKEVRLITTDPAHTIEEYTGTGSRWGLKIEIFHEVRELTPAEARRRYRPSYETDWPAEPNDVLIADHFPGVQGHKIFDSYADWFKGMSLWLPQLSASRRVGLREIEPGIWVGRRSKIARSAKLLAPCWIGDNVRIGADSVIGPVSFIEDQVVVEERSMIVNSWIGPETFVGTLTELKDSLAWGTLLINWKTGSHTQVTDPFLLTSLAEEKDTKAGGGSARGVITKRFARPFEAVSALAQKLQS
jgi:NDP-sugar pyrophosphorylase family protein